MITDQLVIVRGGGDLATGVIWALRRAGFPVLILESEHPSAIRRTVSLSEAVYEGTATVEDITVRLARNLDQAQYFLFEDGIAMLVDPEGRAIRDIIDTEEKYSEWDTGLTTLEGGGRHLFLTAVVDAILSLPELYDSQRREIPLALSVLEARAALEAFGEIEALGGVDALVRRHQAMAALVRREAQALGYSLYQKSESGCTALNTTLLRPDTPAASAFEGEGIVTPGNGALAQVLLRVNHYGEHCTEEDAARALETLKGLL